MTIEKWLSNVYYDDLGGTQIWNRCQDVKSQLVAEVRGWGALQNEFSAKEDAARFQDEVGEFIVQAIREKLSRQFIEIGDEVIYEKATFHDGSDYSLGQHNGFIEGAKWMREKLKSIK